MGDTLITVVAIFLAGVLMFVFPLMSISERNDDISQMAVQTETVNFVDNVRSTGKLTQNNYNAFVQTLSATGNAYEVELEIKRIDENPGKKTSMTAVDKIGENTYYSEYNSQILDKLLQDNNNGSIALKEGDIFTVKVKNTNTTIAQSLKNFFYGLTGNDTAQIEASHSGVVTANGSNN